MSYPFPFNPSRNGRHDANTPSPLRHASNVSSTSSEQSGTTDTFPPSRTSTISSHASAGHPHAVIGTKRTIAETSPTKQAALPDYQYVRDREPTYRVPPTERQSLRTLPQAPSFMSSSPTSPESKRQSREGSPKSASKDDVFAPQQPSSPTSKPQVTAVLGRSGSMRRAKDDVSTRERPGAAQSGILDTSELDKLGRSTTKHFRTLSKFAEEAAEDDFKITSREQAVAGLQGRRRLQRNMSTKGKRQLAAPGYGGRTWMDQQRQFLQAYEYLCHIGEAKEWIEDVIHQDIPPIVQLEEALRDGVTLAEVVQTFHPEKKLRIFRNPKLQFRHSDNIALFFKFLGEVELPELFRFELVDLYEKKNIPKVIYCIHALSWLLFRKGMLDFKIGNLVGQLEFEHHELEEMQKGLDNAGIHMPNFSGMGEKFGAEPEPEPEPVETEEDRINRELDEAEGSIVDLQAQLRAAMVRIRLGDSMQGLWDHEDTLVYLQARIRGDFARQIFEYRLQMRKFAVDLQSAARGFIIRSQEADKHTHWQESTQEVIKIQSLFRARAARQETQTIKQALLKHHEGLRGLQAAIRGALTRGEYENQHAETMEIGPIVAQLQGKIRGYLARQACVTENARLQQNAAQLLVLQSAIRGLLTRQEQTTFAQRVHDFAPDWDVVQASARGFLLREQIKTLRQDLSQYGGVITGLQALVKGGKVRHDYERLKQDLFKCDTSILQLQSSIRGFTCRKRHQSQKNALIACSKSIIELQSMTRAHLQSEIIHDILINLDKHEESIIELQSLARAMRQNNSLDELHEKLQENEDEIEQFQAIARAYRVRKAFVEKKRFFNDNIQKVVKLQSFVRGKQQGEQYKSLTSGKNPPVNTVKNFVHLLNDSDLDFDEEVETEKQQKALVQKVQENEQIERFIEELDAKIGLLAHTKIASDEIAKLKKHYGAQTVGSITRNSSIRDGFNSKTLNKDARAKLERYGELFFMLQTQPQYLARLFRRRREQSTNDSDHKRLESLVMSTFGFAQKRREEYFLLKVLARSVKEEVKTCDTLQEFLRGNFFFARVFNTYTRQPKDRKFIRSLLGPLIKEQIVENQHLDLESDPLQIYRASLNDEELRTGQRSQRNPNIPREEAIKDPQTRQAFIQHLQDLRDIVDTFLLALEEALSRMPYGVRCVAQQMFETLCEKFPREDTARVLQVVGNWIWRAYFKPSLTDPETTGIVDRGLDSAHKRNLGEFAKVASQVAAGRLFGDENVYLQPLNNYLTEAIAKVDDIWAAMINIPDAETKFDIGEFNDLYAKVKPMLYIKMTDVFAMHQLVSNEISSLCLSHDETALKEVVRDLGSAKHNEAEMGAGASEVTLTLTTKMHNYEDPDAEIKAMFMETKRCVLFIIQIQSGANLMDILLKPCSSDDEDRWAALVREELATGNSRKRKTAYSEHSSSSRSSNLLDISSMTYAELKSICLESVILLEQAGRISRHNQYQDLLNSIALDIRTKHKRRVQRQRELENVRGTISQLDEKQRWLEEKLKVYNDTFEQNLKVLQTRGKGKKKFLMPFSKQYNHEKELERLGRMPQFGSYKRSAEDLLHKGILLSWEGRDLKADDVTVSSDDVNYFVIEGSRGSMMITGASEEFTWDWLLDAEYNGRQVIEFFGGPSERPDSSALDDASEVSGGARSSMAVSRRGTSRAGHRSDLGPRYGVLRLDRRLFMQWLSKKFWPDS